MPRGRRSRVGAILGVVSAAALGFAGLTLVDGGAAGGDVVGSYRGAYYASARSYKNRNSGSGCKAPGAAFSSSVTEVVQGGSVDFFDDSTNDPTEWSWIFITGTPSTSTAQNPTITYNTVGTYGVQLTVTNACGSDVAQDFAYITVTAP